MRILLVEDDERIRVGMATGLEARGFDVATASSVAEARACLRGEHFAAVVLDWLLPDGSGLDLLTELRREGSRVPVLMLTARGEISDRVEGLEGGADDYLVKPVALAEVCARLRALTRRTSGAPYATTVEVGPLRLDRERQRAEVHGHEIPLTQREYSLLEELALHPGESVAREILVRRALRLGEMSPAARNLLDVHMHNLRKKLRGRHGGPVLSTVRGIGFRLEVES